MGGLSAVTLAVNGLSLVLALSFLLLLLWYDMRKRTIQFFTLFVIFVMVWNAGSMLMQALLILTPDAAAFHLGIGLLELGFSGASVALYAFVMVLVGLYRRSFRIIAVLSMTALVFFRVLIIVSVSPETIDFANPQSYRFAGLPILLFLVFDLLTLAMLWFHRRKLNSRMMSVGIVAFVIGQGIAFMNPDLPIVSLSTNISSFAALLMSLAIVQQEMITPIRELNAQVSTLHNVTTAISSRLNPELVLSEISARGAMWLAADAVAIFLRQGQTLELKHAYNLPADVQHFQVRVGEWLVGSVVETQKSVLLENYGRDWTRDHVMPYARETFGSVLCVPLLYGGEAMGALMMIAAKHGRLFRREDVSIVELLAAQAAVTIAHSRLFDDVESARHQLETLLVSTENPVIALDVNDQLIFANPAALAIPSLERAIAQNTLTAFVHEPEPGTGGLTYELMLDGRTYLCHVAALGSHTLEGRVAVMNDITQLKELDRVKSEMVRMASHDLKNPLMGAMLHLDLLQASAQDEQQALIDVVNQQLDRMERIIGGVLDLERLKDSAKAGETVELNPLIEDVMRDLKRYADQKSLTLEAALPDDTLRVIGDVDQLERALANLVENAIKFTPEGGKIAVCVTCSQGKAQVEVRDNGIGIPQALQPMVFERFFRGQQPGAEHVAGSGLGLNIVKTIIEKHGGQVWLVSEEGQGTSFFVSLPLINPSVCTTEQGEP